MILGATLHDSADLVRAVAWPVIILLVVVALWPVLRLAGREAVQRGFKLGLPGGTSFELPAATPAAPTGTFTEALSAPISSAEFQQAAGARMQSGVESIKSLLSSGVPSDYIEVNLRDGQSWLTSRLFLVASLLDRVLGARVFVFVATAGGVSRRFIGIASTVDVRSALRTRYPWLEASLYKAYIGLGSVNVYFDDLTNWQGIQLVQSFLSDLQSPASPNQSLDGWTYLQSSRSYEHASWISDGDLQSLLGEKLSRSSVSSGADLQHRLQSVIRASGDYVASVNDLSQLDTVIDRRAVLEDVARKAAAA